MHFTKSKQLLRFQGWFCLINVFLLWMIGFRYLLTLSDWFQTWLTSFAKIQVAVFLISAYIGHFALIAFIPCILLIPLIVIFPYKKFIFPLAIVANTIIVTFILADSLVYQHFHFHIHGIIVQMIFSPMAREIFDFGWFELVTIALAIVGILALEIMLAWLVWRKFILEEKPRGHGKWWGILLAACFYFSLLILIFSSNYTVFRYFILTSRILPFYNTVFADLIPNAHAKIGIARFGETYIVQPHQTNKPMRYPLHPLQCTPPQKPYNIAFIFVDTWRFDMLNPTNMPNLYKFAQQSWVFNNHFSGGNSTRPGIFSIFYGIPANYWTSTKLQHIKPVFMDKLNQYHYNLGVFASAELTLPAFNKNVFYGIRNLQIETPGDNSKQRDEYTSKEFSNFITKQMQAKNKKPFFTYLFYDSAHGNCNSDFFAPFKPAVKTCNRAAMRPSVRQLYFNRYQNAVYFIDQQIKKDLEVLRNNGLLKNTVVVITGDHGQEYDDNHLGYWGHASNFTKYQVQTPLIIHWPNAKPQVFNYLTSHYDIVPTLLSKIFNCTTPYSDYSVGMGLFNDKPRPYLIVGSYVDFGVITKNRLLTIFPTGNYEIDNKSAKPLPNAKLNMQVLTQVFADLKRFYK